MAKRAGQVACGKSKDNLSCLTLSRHREEKAVGSGARGGGAGQWAVDRWRQHTVGRGVWRRRKWQTGGGKEEKRMTVKKGTRVSP